MAGRSTSFRRPRRVEGRYSILSEAIDNEETPVLRLFAGQSQELLRGRRMPGCRSCCTSRFFTLTQINERLGQQFPGYEKFRGEPAGLRADLAADIESVGVHRKWPASDGRSDRLAVNPIAVPLPGGRAFPLSDHADFPELIELVKRVAPKRVFTLQVSQRICANVARVGFEARALSEEEQLALPCRLEVAGCRFPVRGTETFENRFSRRLPER